MAYINHSNKLAECPKHEFGIWNIRNPLTLLYIDGDVISLNKILYTFDNKVVKVSSDTWQWQPMLDQMNFEWAL